MACSGVMLFSWSLLLRKIAIIGLHLLLHRASAKESSGQCAGGPEANFNLYGLSIRYVSGLSTLLKRLCVDAEWARFRARDQMQFVLYVFTKSVGQFDLAPLSLKDQIYVGENVEIK
jgi:hypothetical protein